MMLHCFHFNYVVGQHSFQHYLGFRFVDWLLLCVCARCLWSRRNAGRPIECPSSLVLILIEEVEEVSGAPKEEEMPACKQEDKEEAAPEVGAAEPHVNEEPLTHD